MSFDSSVDVHHDEFITSIPRKRYEFTWKIGQFSIWLEHVEGLQQSAAFPNDPTEKLQWCLQFKPKSRDANEYCSLYLKLIKSTGFPNIIKANFTLSFVNSNGTTLLKMSSKEVKFQEESRFGWRKAVLATLLEKVMPEDVLEIKCSIEARPEIVTKSVKTSLIKLPHALPSSFSKDLETLVGGDKFGDVALIVGEETLQAHKSILTARSPVFAAMFEHNMQEAAQNCVVIEDVDPTVFKALLRYIYSDKVTCLNSKAHELYAVADKYGIPTLKSLCRNHILQKLDPGNAADTLKLADLHSDPEMKRYTLEFISGSAAAKVTKTAGWQKMVRTHPHLVDETVDALAARIS